MARDPVPGSWERFTRDEERNEEAKYAKCSECGKPAVKEVSCWKCEGKGTVLPLGGYRPQTCRECGGTGKLARCAKHATKE